MVRFDAESHTYWLGSQRVPSVTQILKPVSDFSMVKPEVLEYKRALGTAVHYATELWDQEVLDMSSVDEAVLPYLEGWILFRRETDFVVQTIEERVFHPSMIYAGTLDRTGLLFGDESLLDIKTSAQLSPPVGMQLAAYQEALASGVQKRRPKRRYAVKLNDDGTYRLEEYIDPNDWPAFLSLKTVMAWADKHKTKVSYEPRN